MKLQPWGEEVRTLMWVLLFSLLALSLVPGQDYHITQGFDPRKNCLANKGPELFPKSANPDEDCGPFGQCWP